jgi:hypothetical protein
MANILSDVVLGGELSVLEFNVSQFQSGERLVERRERRLSVIAQIEYLSPV